VSHYSSASRSNHVVLHHTGGANNHTIETNQFCNFSGGHYDFAVTRQGRIFVCASSSGNQYWNDTNGAHALRCNCRKHSRPLRGVARAIGKVERASPATVGNGLG
jgi:hypothetical protein